MTRIEEREGELLTSAHLVDHHDLKVRQHPVIEVDRHLIVSIYQLPHDDRRPLLDGAGGGFSRLSRRSHRMPIPTIGARYRDEWLAFQQSSITVTLDSLYWPP